MKKEDTPRPALGKRRGKGGGFVADEVQVDLCSSKKLTMLAAERVEDVLSLCLVGSGKRRLTGTCCLGEPECLMSLLLVVGSAGAAQCGC
jgi:hypothetical protein